MVIPAPLVYIKVVAVKKLIGLLCERLITREGNYLVFLLVSHGTKSTQSFVPFQTNHIRNQYVSGLLQK